MKKTRTNTVICCIALFAGMACETLPDAPTAESATRSVAGYRIGPTDQLEIRVWRNEALSVTAPVRPDGYISVPLVGDVQAAGESPQNLAAEIQRRLEDFIESPRVDVIVSDFVGALEDQVRVIGEAADPKAIPYRHQMTVLDVMIQVGGLTPFAAGNRAILVRRSGTEQERFRVRLDALLNDGDMTADVPIEPGDVLIIPESFF